MEKLEHRFKAGQKVKLQHKGSTHHGRIEALGHDDRLHIRLDSGHQIIAHASNDQVEPADFESGSETPTKASITVAQLDGLRRALALGKLDEVDALKVRDCFAKLETVVSLDGPETAWERTLREMCAKHLGNPAGAASDGFTKAAGSYPTYRVGDLVKDRVTGKTGRITNHRTTAVDIDFGNGTTGTYLLDVIEPAA